MNSDNSVKIRLSVVADQNNPQSVQQSKSAIDEVYNHARRRAQEQRQFEINNFAEIQRMHRALNAADAGSPNADALRVAAEIAMERRLSNERRQSAKADADFVVREAERKFQAESNAIRRAELLRARQDAEEKRQARDRADFVARQAERKFLAEQNTIRRLEQEERRYSAQQAAEERRRVAASESLQRQRSASITRQLQQEQNERRRYAENFQREYANIQQYGNSNGPNGPGGGGGGFFSGITGSLGFGAGVGAFAGTMVANMIMSITRALRDGVQAWFEYSAHIEQVRIGFTTMLGSGKAAESLLNQLLVMARTTPFEFKGLSDAARRLLALGTASKEVLPLLTAVGNAVSAAGGGEDQFQRVVYAVGDIQAKGKLTGEEIRQLANNGIPVFKILQEQLGLTNKEIFTLIRSSSIGADQFLEAFKKFSQVHFGDAMEAQSHTALGALSNVKDALLQIADHSLAPLFNLIRDGIDSTATSLMNNQNSWESWGQKVSSTIAFEIDMISKLLGKVNDVDNWIADKTGLKEAADESAKMSEDMQTGMMVTASALWYMAFGSEGGGTGKLNKDWMKYGMPTIGNNPTSVSSQLDSLYNLQTPAEFTADQTKKKDAAAMSKKLQTMYNDLLVDIEYFGDKSKVADYKKRLLAAGADLNSEDAKSILAAAATLDAKNKEKFTSDQLTIARKIVNTGIGLGANQNQVLAALSAALVESGAKNLAFGDRDSLGVFQQRPSQGWGTQAQIKNVDYAIRAFFLGANSNKGVLDVSQAGSIGSIAQRVQRSAFPKRYDQKLGDARNLLAEVMGDGQISESDMRELEVLRMKHLLKPIMDRQKNQPIETTPIDEDMFWEGRLNYKKSESQKRFDSQAQEVNDATNAYAMDKYNLGGLVELEKQKAFIEGQRRILDYTLDATRAEARYHELVLENLDEAAVAERRRLEVGQERLQLGQHIQDLEDELANSGANSALKYREAWLGALRDVQRADEEAVTSQIQSQVQIADQSVFHAQQARARIMESMAQSGGITDAFSDAFIHSASLIDNSITRLLDHMNRGMGEFGKILTDIEATFIRMVTNKLIMKLVDWLLDGVFGGSGKSGGITGAVTGAVTGGGGGNSFASAALPAALGLLTGGGNFQNGVGTTNGGGFNLLNMIKNPFSALLGGGANSNGPSVQTWGEQSGATWANFKLGSPGDFIPLLKGGFGGGGGLLKSLGGMAGGLAPILPFLGASLGMGLGKGSTPGSIMGLLGGGLAGVGILAGLSAATLGGIGGSLGASLATGLGGIFGTTSGLGGIFAGLFGGAGSMASFAAIAGPAALIAIPLLIGASLLSRNKQRRKEEEVRNTTILDAFSQLDRIKHLVEIHRMDGAEGVDQAMQVRAQYVQQMSQLKDKKTRSHALADVSRLDIKIAAIKSAATKALNETDFDRKLIPEFAIGGVVPGRPGSPQLVLAHGGEVILNPAQQASVGASTLAQANVPGVRSNGGGGSSEQSVHVEVSLGTETQDRILVNGLEQPRARRKLGRTVNELIKGGEIG